MGDAVADEFGKMDIVDLRGSPRPVAVRQARPNGAGHATGFDPGYRPQEIGIEVIECCRLIEDIALANVRGRWRRSEQGDRGSNCHAEGAHRTR